MSNKLGRRLPAGSLPAAIAAAALAIIALIIAAYGNASAVGQGDGETLASGNGVHRAQPAVAPSKTSNAR